MSRYTATHEDGNAVAYGLDHAVGWFYQEFDDCDTCVVDEDSMFTGLKGYELAEKLKMTSAPAHHGMAIISDLDPGVYDAN